MVVYIRMAIAVSLTLFASAAMLTGVANAALSSAERETQAIDGFIANARENQQLAQDAIAKAVDIAGSLKTEVDSRPLAITEGLRELYPQFRAALESLGEENLEAATPLLTALSQEKDPYLAADATYFLARVFLLAERYEQSLPLLESLEKDHAAHTARGGEALFLKGVCQGQLLRRQDAIASLERYLKEYPHAPERMKVGAWRQLEQLKMVEDGTLSDVQVRMDFSRRRLALEDTGDQTQEEQKKIVSLLEKLIKEAEERECNCKGGGSGQSKSKKQGKAGEGEGENSGKPSEGNQAGQSGGGSKGTDSAAAERLHRGGPQSPWSKLRDKDRDPVFNAIKEKFPGRYQQLIEEYYKSFQDEEES